MEYLWVFMSRIIIASANKNTLFLFQFVFIFLSHVLVQDKTSSSILRVEKGDTLVLFLISVEMLCIFHSN